MFKCSGYYWRESAMGTADRGMMFMFIALPEYLNVLIVKGQIKDELLVWQKVNIVLNN